MRLSWLRQSDYKSSYQYNVSVNGERLIQSISETTNVTNLITGNNYTFTVQTVANGMSSDSVAISAFTGITIHILLKHLFLLYCNPLMALYHNFPSVLLTVLSVGLCCWIVFPPLLFGVIRAWQSIQYFCGWHYSEHESGVETAWWHCESLQCQNPVERNCFKDRKPNECGNRGVLRPATWNSIQCHCHKYQWTHEAGQR